MKRTHPNHLRHFIRSAAVVLAASSACLAAPATAPSTAPAQPAAANPAAQQAQPQTITLTVRPAALPEPALRYRLTVPAHQKVPGNAAPLYLMAAGYFSQSEEDFAEQKLTEEDLKRFGLKQPERGEYTWADAFLEVPLDKMRSPELERILSRVRDANQMLERAVRQESCNWNLPLREHGFATLLPHINSIRALARGVAVKARAEVARGDIEAALQTLRLNFALARDMESGAVLVQQLVGAAIASQSLKVLQEAVAQPDCPNLYWALADLPSPYFDARESLEMEQAVVYWMFPELLKVRDGTFAEADWATLLNKLSALAPMMRPSDGGGGTLLQQKAEMLGASVLLYPAARQFLIDTGLTPEQVDAIPKPVALGRYVAESYERAYDDILKWSLVPFWQARERLEAAELTLKQRAPGLATNPLLLVVPVVSRAMHGMAKLDRLVAAQRTVEALRAHAAANDGQLPKSLGELTQVPPPIDPMTGKPFDYRVEGNTAVLQSLDEKSPRDGLVVRVTMVAG